MLHMPIPFSLFLSLVPDNVIGVGIQVLAGGAVLHVLPGKRRTGGDDGHLLSEAGTQVPKGWY